MTDTRVIKTKIQGKLQHRQGKEATPCMFLLHFFKVAYAFYMDCLAPYDLEEMAGGVTGGTGCISRMLTWVCAEPSKMGLFPKGWCVVFPAGCKEKSHVTQLMYATMPVEIFTVGCRGLPRPYPFLKILFIWQMEFKLPVEARWCLFNAINTKSFY